MTGYTGLIWRTTKISLGTEQRITSYRGGILQYRVLPKTGMFTATLWVPFKITPLLVSPNVVHQVEAETVESVSENTQLGPRLTCGCDS